jgi:hypothetical protein
MTKSQVKTALTFIVLAILFFISSRFVLKFFFMFFLIGLIFLILGISILKGSKK